MFTTCCPPCDTVQGGACANVRHGEGQHGPNWPLGFTGTLGWCGMDECRARMCPNYLLCGRAHPVLLLDTKTGRCLYCSMTFGNTTFRDGTKHADCPVCLSDTEKHHVHLPLCTHTLCTACARRILSLDEPRCPLCRSSTRDG